jgi:hypothetical protein
LFTRQSFVIPTEGLLGQRYTGRAGEGQIEHTAHTHSGVRVMTHHIFGTFGLGSREVAARTAVSRTSGSASVTPLATIRIALHPTHERIAEHTRTAGHNKQRSRAQQYKSPRYDHSVGRVIGAGVVSKAPEGAGTSESVSAWHNIQSHMQHKHSRAAT